MMKIYIIIYKSGNDINSIIELHWRTLMSDYDKTQREFKNGKVTYVTGGSRLTPSGTLSRDTFVSKAGDISPADIASLNEKIPAQFGRSKEQLQALINTGHINLQEIKDQGYKFSFEEDLDDGVDHVYYGTRKYPKSSKVFPGDLVEFRNTGNDKLDGHFGRVVHVRSFSTYTTSINVSSGPYAGSKQVVEGDQYVILHNAKNGLHPNDYLRKIRSDIIKEDN